MATPRAPRRKPKTVEEVKQSIHPSAGLADLALGIRGLINKMDTLALSSGAILKLKRVSDVAINRAVFAIEKPTVPQHYIADDDRYEDNPDDPEYKDAMLEWSVRTIEVARRILFYLGTECLSVPEGMFRPEEDGWLTLLHAAGVPTITQPREDTGRLLGARFDVGLEPPPGRWARFKALFTRPPEENSADLPETSAIDTEVAPDDAGARYIEWLELYAMQRPEVDERLLFMTVAEKNLVAEGRVRQALDYFRSLEIRGADQSGAADADD